MIKVGDELPFFDYEKLPSTTCYAISFVRAVASKICPARCVMIDRDQNKDFAERNMKEEFEDIRITGKPDHAKVKAGSKTYTRIFFLPLSSAPPQRWNELLVQEWACRTMQSPRHIWINGRELAIDCPGKELALIVGRVGTDIQTVNRKYRNEVESSRIKTEPERQQAEEEKRVVDDSIKQAIDELKLPG